MYNYVLICNYGIADGMNVNMYLCVLLDASCMVHFWMKVYCCVGCIYFGHMQMLYRYRCICVQIHIILYNYIPTVSQQVLPLQEMNRYPVSVNLKMPLVHISLEEIYFYLSIISLRDGYVNKILTWWCCNNTCRPYCWVQILCVGCLRSTYRSKRWKRCIGSFFQDESPTSDCNVIHFPINSTNSTRVSQISQRQIVQFYNKHWIIIRAKYLAFLYIVWCNHVFIALNKQKSGYVGAMYVTLWCCHEVPIWVCTTVAEVACVNIRYNKGSAALDPYILACKFKFKCLKITLLSLF